ncbi:GTP-binding protein RAD-like [Saccostrea echinata]|uniref:GTP-binding protein RAD-like n=1 Tax=Saccostrea echinata TaxID=191078 RepID=UPI002A83B055|nr:GTP-binding protein RAD-like [Saccostrea echinata]
MKSNDPQIAVDEIYHPFREHAKTLAAFDFKKLNLPPVRVRASTFSCRRPSVRSTLVTDVQRVRNFSLSNLGIENKGDSFRNSSEIVGSPGKTKYSRRRRSLKKEQQFYPISVTIDENSDDFIRPICNSIGKAYNSKGGTFRIKVIGDKLVGKTMMVKQMTTSEFVGLQEMTEKSNFTTIPVHLDGEESIVELEEVEFYEPYRHTVYVDAFIMMYSISDEASFLYVLREVSRLREALDVDRPIIMVANKTDLNRNRVVSTKEGKTAAQVFSCKYVETSVSFHVKIDELLVALVRQIRLTLDPKTINGNEYSKLNRHIPRRFVRARTLLHRLFGRKSKSRRNKEVCEEIFKL